MEPSVAQPPLPLQVFLPLQPASPVLQPPLPLQEFCPLRACFSFFASQMLPEDCPASALLEDNPWPAELEETVLAFRRVIVPPSRPVNAAVSTKELLETFMILYTPSFVGYSRIPQNYRAPVPVAIKHIRTGSLEYTTVRRGADDEVPHVSVRTVRKACNKKSGPASMWE